METSVKAAEVMVSPQPGVASSASQHADGADGEVAACSSSSSSSSDDDFFDPMEEFSRRLEDIVSAYGSAASLLDKQAAVEAEMEKMRKETKDDVTAAMETDVSAVMQGLKKLPSPEKKLDELLRKFADLAAVRRCDEQKLCVLQQRLSVVLDERQQLQAETRSCISARSQLEGLCRELQGHYCCLKEKTIRRCREQEEKKQEMTSHFQTMLTEIQAQIEQHSARNDKLCHENSNLTDKLESLMSQCEMREESLEKINQRRDLQNKLTEAKLQQANALLAEAEDKHKREKEYLLREAIDKTKKCFAMKEQELSMKKKLTLYAQKFDEFQATLAKSNEIYVRFKNEMDNMSDKMKKMEKESNLWKTRFENCNKALTDMIEERSEKSKEYDVFVLKIQKLECLCRALQEERVVLYGKIKEVRQANADLPSKVFGGSDPAEPLDAEDKDKPAPLTPAELQELQQLQDEDPVLTEGMSRLKEEQAKLQQFAASLLATPTFNEEEDNAESDPEEDSVAAAFGHFKTKPRVRVPEPVADVKPEAAESVPPQPDQVQEVPQPDQVQEVPQPAAPGAPPPVEGSSGTGQVQTQVQDKLKDEIQQRPAEPAPTPETAKTDLPTDRQPEAAEAELPVEAEPAGDQKVQVEPAGNQKVQVEPAVDQKVQVEPVGDQKVQVEPAGDQKVQVEPAGDQKVQAEPVGDQKVQVEPERLPEEAATKSASAAPSKDTPATAASSKKQTPKKKKKRNGKNAS